MSDERESIEGIARRCWVAAKNRESVRRASEMAREMHPKSSEAHIGNAAAVREALEDLMKFTCNCCQERYCEEDVEEEDGQRIPSPCSVIIKARDALNLGLRNCDVGTAEEQAKRIDAFCKSHGTDKNGYYRCEECPLLEIDRCELKWAQMPYEEGGAK